MKGSRSKWMTEKQPRFRRWGNGCGKRKKKQGKAISGNNDESRVI